MVLSSAKNTHHHNYGVLCFNQYHLIFRNTTEVNQCSPEQNVSLNNLLTCAHYLVQPTITLGVIFQSRLLRAVKLFRKHFYLLEPPLVVKKEPFTGGIFFGIAERKTFEMEPHDPRRVGKIMFQLLPFPPPTKAPRSMVSMKVAVKIQQRRKWLLQVS